VKVLWKCAECGCEKWRPESRAAGVITCSVACRSKYQRRMAVHPTHTVIANRLKRIMFRFGLTEREAKVYWQGYKAGRQMAAAVRYQTKTGRIKPPVVGSSHWEQQRSA
jgi:hypothetical protein